MTYFRFICAINFLIASYLFSLWFDSSGHMRSFDWTPPLAVVLDISNPVPLRSNKNTIYMNALDRPIFSIDRRQPLPPKPPELPPPPDLLDSLKIKAVYAGPDLQGIIAEVGTKLVRIKVGEFVGVWQLSNVTDDAVVFSKNDVARKIQFKRR